MALRSRQTVVMLPMRVWDLPVRLFHWLIVVLIPLSYLSIKGGFPDVHKAIGFTMIALLLFRVAWGLFGSDTARFARFLRSPGAAFHHLGAITRREPDTVTGHNAAGGWMVALMLLLLLLQAFSGLFARNRHNVEGPLAKYLDDAAVQAVSFVHAANFKVIFAAAVLHVAVIGVYLFVKKQNLIRPMLTGKKRLPAATRAPRMASPLLALLFLILAAAIAAALATQF